MDGRIKKFWVGITILLMAAALILCVFASWRGSLYIKPSGNPQYTVTRFFDALLGGRYSQAYACLSDYASLGLEKEPESAEAKQVYDAIRNSFNYTLSGSSTVHGLEATQRVVLHSMNLRMTENAIQQRVNGILEEMVQTLPANEVYDGNGGYLTSFTDAIYVEALNQALQNTEMLSTDTQLEMQLKYQDGMWKIVTDRNLMTALVGGEN